VRPLRARAAYLAYRAGAELARRVPPSVGEPLGRTVSRAMVRAWPRKRRQVARNLVRASRGALSGAALERAVNEVFTNYGRYWHEMFRLPDDVRHGVVAERFDGAGAEHVAAARERGCGAILAVPHLGNWDYAGAWLVGCGYPLVVVAEPVEPPELFEWFVRVRRAIGMDVVSLGPGATSSVLHALHTNRIVCLVCDRDLGGDGVEVEFFGERTTFPAGPATLALRTGAPLLHAGVYLEPHGGHTGTIFPSIDTTRAGRFRDDVVRVTQSLAHVFENLISAAPEQWLMMQPVWPSDRAVFDKFRQSDEDLVVGSRV